MNAEAAQVAPFNWREPDYAAVYEQRAAYLQRIRSHPEILPGLKAHYAQHPAQFIQTWGWTTDPRSIAKGRPALVPFVLFPKQMELIEWMVERWKGGDPCGSDSERPVQRRIPVGRTLVAAIGRCRFQQRQRAVDRGYGFSSHGSAATARNGQACSAPRDETEGRFRDAVQDFGSVLGPGDLLDR